MEASASLVTVITDNDLFHSNSHINQMLPQIFHILLFCLVDMMMFPKILYLTGLGQGCSAALIWKFILSTMISEIIALFRLSAVNDTQNVGVDTACKKRSRPGEIIKHDNVISQHIYI